MKERHIVWTQERCLHIQNILHFLRITILKIILVTNNSETHGMTLNERFNAAGLGTAGGVPPQVEEVGETTS